MLLKSLLQILHIDYHEVVSAHLMNEDHYNRTKDYSFLSNVLKDGVVIG